MKGIPIPRSKEKLERVCKVPDLFNKNQNISSGNARTRRVFLGERILKKKIRRHGYFYNLIPIVFTAELGRAYLFPYEMVKMNESYVS